MGILVSTLLALSAAEPTMPAQAIHYERLGEGLMRSRFVRKGMTVAQARQVFGGWPEGSFGSIGRTDCYRSCGVNVDYALDENCEYRVSNVDWYFRPFRR